MDTYDSWKLASDPQLGEEPVEEEDEEELSPPSVEEIWDTHRGEFIHEATFASGHKFAVRRTLSGAFRNDFEVVGPNGFYSDGYLSPECALAWLCDDPEHWSW